MNRIRKLCRDTLRESAKLKNGKQTTLVASSAVDLSMALNWLKLNGMVRAVSGGTSAGKDGRYYMTIRHTGSKRDLIDFVDDRFGEFVEVI